MKTVYVTNNGDEPLKARVAQTDYEFMPKQEVPVPEFVAKHVFGYGDDKKEPYFVRLGWMKMNTDFPVAMEKLRQFSFSAQSTNVHLSAPVVERVAAPVPKARVAAKVAKKNNE